METIPEIAGAVAALLFNEAVKESGKSLSKSVTQKVQQMTLLVRQRFSAAGTEGLLLRTEKQPTETNITMVKTELENQMQEDNTLPGQLRELINEIKAASPAYQSALSNLKGDTVKIDIVLKQHASNGRRSVQEFGKNIQAAGDMNIKADVTQIS
jgi:gas vesicle protein